MACNYSARVKHLRTDSAQSVTRGVRHSPKGVKVSRSILAMLHVKQKWMRTHCQKGGVSTDPGNPIVMFVFYLHQLLGTKK